MRVAFVVPRYGEQAEGDAEALCRLVAERMARHWDLDVLTTCALEDGAWADHFPAGTARLNGVTVRRFAVASPRDLTRFDQLSSVLRARPDPSAEQRDACVREHGPWSPDLLAYMASVAEGYDFFIFFGYAHALSYFGLPLVPGKAVLVPLARDDGVIRLPIWEARFRDPVRIVFTAPEEKAFLLRRFAGFALGGPTIGVGVERPTDIEPSRFRKAYGVGDDFVLYTGRVDPSRGCGLLFDHFVRHIEAGADGVKLVTLGETKMEMPSHPRIVALGAVPQGTKWDALAACDVLVAPSPDEILPVALLEAWSAGKPVLVNAQNEAFRGQVVRANGGLFFGSHEDFSGALGHLRTTGDADVLGRQGFEYVQRHCRWEPIEAAYLDLGRMMKSVSA